MSEDTKQTPDSDAPTATSNTAGETQGQKSTSARPAAAPAAGAGPNADIMGGAMSGEPKFRGKRRRKVSYLTINKIFDVDYKDVAILRRFINEHGKILSSRITGNTAKQQRMIARAIRRAREVALLPFVVTEMSAERPMRGRGPRRDYGDRDRDRGGDRDGGRDGRDRNESSGSNAD